jgi:Ca2+-binding EF-hand superfamily protein
MKGLYRLVNTKGEAIDHSQKTDTRQENRMSAEEEDLNKLPELTPMEEVKLRELYNKIDKNRDGKIDIKDLSTALSEMEVAQLPGHAQVPITFVYS